MAAPQLDSPAAEEPIVCTTLRWRELDSKFQFRATFGSHGSPKYAIRAEHRVLSEFVSTHCTGKSFWIRLPVDRLRRLAQHGDLLSLTCRCGHPLHFKNDATVLSAPVMPMSSSRAAEYSRCTMDADAPRSPFAGMGDLSAALLCPRSDEIICGTCKQRFAGWRILSSIEFFPFTFYKQPSGKKAGSARRSSSSA